MIPWEVRNENNSSVELDFVSLWNCFVNLSIMGQLWNNSTFQISNLSKCSRKCAEHYTILLYSNDSFHVAFIIKSTRTNRNLSKYVINILVSDLLWSSVIHSKKTNSQSTVNFSFGLLLYSPTLFKRTHFLHFFLIIFILPYQNKYIPCFSLHFIQLFSVVFFLVYK